VVLVRDFLRGLFEAVRGGRASPAPVERRAASPLGEARLSDRELLAIQDMLRLS
jgi:hypothetical protein